MQLLFGAHLKAIALRDRMFIQEIINDLDRNNCLGPGSKAGTLLNDWAYELGEKACIQDNEVRAKFDELVGEENW